MYYTDEELKRIGFKSIGVNVKISNKSSIYFPENIEIGNNVRIDDFCILSPSRRLSIGNYVHIACFVSIIGSGDIIIEDFCGLSGKVSLYSSTDDYSGQYLTNPMIPIEFKNVLSGPVTIKKHTIIGTNSVILPDTLLKEGVAVGALSLIKGTYESFSVYFGIPAKKIKSRNKNLIELEKKIK